MLALILVHPGAASGNQALIVYDGAVSDYSEGLISARHIANLLGHFQMSYDISPLSKVQPGHIQNYAVLFVVCQEAKTVLPARFLNELQNMQGTICWINRHIGQFLHHQKSTSTWGFKFEDYIDDEDFDQVRYRGVILRKGDPELNLIKVEDSQVCRVLATAKCSDGVWPYMIQSRNLWYIADSPFSYVEEGDRYLAFCDLLHDILRRPHAESNQALVRIEDVSVDDDPADLRHVADFLSERNIPFQVSIIPIYRDPSKGIEIYLSDRPRFVETLKYMVSKGGVLVMHGVSHQRRGISADDYEFWDDLKDHPLPLDSTAFVESRMELGLRECFKNGLYPLAWETPHYAASSLDYTVFGKFFRLSNERRMVIDRLGTQQYFPYLVQDIFGQWVVPENLGYISQEDPEPQRLVEDAAKMRAVRDGMPSFFFHCFMKLDYLSRVVQGIQSAGYRFVSLNSFDCQVNSHDRTIRSQTGKAVLNLENQFLREAVLDSKGKIVSESVSDSPLNGKVEREVKLSSGQVAVLEALAEKPQPAVKPWYQAWGQWLTRLGEGAVSRQSRNAPLDQAILLWAARCDPPENNDQESYRSLLELYGIHVQVLPVEESGQKIKGGTRLIIVPYASGSRLSPAAVESLIQHLQEGGYLVLEGETQLSRRLGINFGDHSLQMINPLDLNFPDVPLVWQPPVSMVRFEAPRGSQTIAIDQESQAPLCLAGRVGNGQYYFLGPWLDPKTALGTSHFPFFLQTLRSLFNLQPRVRRPQLEAYFDPGLRAGISLERLVRSWQSSGIRLIYAAAWGTGYRQWNFNYKYLIDLCHKNGILVYAWFELPQVNERFWDEHPHWREKTAAGTDARISWRLPMNLQNADCRKAALAWVNEVLEKFDWDGVNLAELNFDSPGDPGNPAQFVPLNPEVRRTFQAESGFDPMELFNSASRYYWKNNPRLLQEFYSFRTRLVTSWHREVLGFLSPLCLRRNMELVVTMLDSLHSQSLTRETGIDSNAILNLMEEFPFTLQVEDPAEFWASSPERYSRFIETYLKKVKDRRRLIFDLNVIPNRPGREIPFPSRLQTGSELAQMIYSAMQASGRVAIYAESTLSPQDLEMIPFILGSESHLLSREKSWSIEAARNVWLNMDPGVEYWVDGKRWPFLDAGQLLVPQGRHEITRVEGSSTWFDWTRKFYLRVVGFQGDLLDARPIRQGIFLEVDGAARCAVAFSRRPDSIQIDGQPFAFKSIYDQGNWNVFLPPGHLQVEIAAGSSAAFLLDLLSLFSSSVIVILGYTAGGIMAVVYAGILMKRWHARRSMQRNK